MLYINRVACHDPFCLFGFNLDSCTVFRQSTVAEASLLLFNDLSRIENDLEMMVPRFFSAGCRIKSLYRSTSAVFLQLFPFPPTSHNAHSRKRKVAGTTGDNIQNGGHPRRFFLPRSNAADFYREPFVEGIPLTRGSSVTAMQRARAKPLNTASNM